MYDHDGLMIGIPLNTGKVVHAAATATASMTMGKLRGINLNGGVGFRPPLQMRSLTTTYDLFVL
jgi:hypothetical protein